MAAVMTRKEFLNLVRESGLLDENRFAEYFPDESKLPESPADCAALLVRDGFLTQDQVKRLLLASTTVESCPPSSSTRQQLEELDALLRRMLCLSLGSTDETMKAPERPIGDSISESNQKIVLNGVSYFVLNKTNLVLNLNGAKSVVVPQPSNEFGYGQAIYPIHPNHSGQFVFVPIAENRWKLTHNQLQERVVGFSNKNIEDAFADWCFQFHRLFQNLLVKLPFEMTQEEKETWQIIESIVDVEKYRQSIPLVQFQQGKLIQIKLPYYLIRWEGGRKERVHGKRMPAHWITFKEGDRFEAVLYRNPTTFRIRKVVYLNRLHFIKKPIPDIWDQLPTVKDLPDTSWD